MLVGHINSIKRHRKRAKKTKHFSKRNAWKETLNDEINSLKKAKKVVLDCTANKATEIDSKVKSLEEKLYKI